MEHGVRALHLLPDGSLLRRHPKLRRPIPLGPAPQSADSSYTISKTAAERYVEISGLDYVSFRLATRLRTSHGGGPLVIFYQRLSEGKPCFVVDARRDFIYVDDVIDLVMMAVTGTGQGPTTWAPARSADQGPVRRRRRGRWRRAGGRRRGAAAARGRAAHPAARPGADKGGLRLETDHDAHSKGCLGRLALVSRARAVEQPFTHLKTGQQRQKA